jgi:hypothetical protein
LSDAEVTAFRVALGTCHANLASLPGPDRVGGAQ